MNAWHSNPPLARLGTPLLAAALLLAGPGGLDAQAQDQDELLDLGRLYTMWLYEGDFERLWERMLPDVRQAIGSVGNMDVVKDEIVRQVGVEIELLEETVTEAEGFDVYLRFARYDAFDGRILVQFAMDAEGRIGGFYVRPAPGG